MVRLRVRVMVRVRVRVMELRQHCALASGPQGVKRVSE